MKRRQKLSHLVLIMTILLTMITGVSTVSATSSDLFGTIDLRELPEDSEFYRNLDGDWLFFEHELLTPKELEKLVNEKVGEPVAIPSSFAEQTGQVNSFGTYSVRVKIPHQLVGETLAIQVPYQYSAYRLFVDQTEVAKNGEVGHDSASHESGMTPRSGYFQATSTDVLLTMQLSSFDHIRGGFENSIHIGEATVMTRKYSKGMASTLFLNGSIFIIGLFMLLFSWYRKKESLYLIFGLFAMLIAVRALFAEPFYYSLLFPSISWFWGTRLEYILTEATSIAFVTLLWKSHENIFSKKVLYVITVPIGILIVITLFTQPVFFQMLFFTMFYVSIPFFFYSVYVIYKGIYSNDYYKKINLIGIGLIFIAFFNDFFVGNNLYHFISIMLPAVGVYVLIHVVLMSKKFARSTRETEQLNEQLLELNATLDKQVHSRTMQLEEANRDLQELALMDSLTGIHNRHSFNEFMHQTFQQTIEKGTAVSILMLDLDEFKKYNDYYGHIRGDYLLQRIVVVIKKQLPHDSFFARYGGEEFIIVLPNYSKDKAYIIAEQIKNAVIETNLKHPKSQLGIVTLSIGAATMTKDHIFESEVAFIDAADQRLYEAKRKGRNRVV